MNSSRFRNEVSTDAQLKAHRGTHVFLSQADSNRIYDHLMHGSVDEAMTIINRILDRHPSAATDKLPDLYVQIFVVIFRVMNSKGIEYDAEHEGDLAILNRTLACEAQQIRNTMRNYINLIGSMKTAQNVMIEDILAYIDANYAKNNTLRELADMFGLSTSHLSKLINRKTALTYSSYVDSLRIQQAKHLLVTTSFPVNSIYEQIGFISRTTFIRQFKKYVGTTPSNYRKLHRK